MDINKYDINHDFLSPDLMMQVVKKFIDFLDQVNNLHKTERTKPKEKNKGEKVASSDSKSKKSSK